MHCNDLMFILTSSLLMMLELILGDLVGEVVQALQDLGVEVQFLVDEAKVSECPLDRDPTDVDILIILLARTLVDLHSFLCVVLLLLFNLLLLTCHPE